LNLLQTLPDALLNSLKEIKGFEKESFLAAHQQEKPITSVRFNPFKKNNLLNDALVLEEQVPWSSQGYYLQDRPSFTIDPLFHAGMYYVQEASSMFLEEVLKQTCDLSASLKVLDLCAAPGGKSTLIQSLLSPESLLVCNEVIKSRVNILSENITKWGALNTIVTNNDPKDFLKLPAYFDVIVVDAPCSGSGLFRKDANAISEWSENNVALCNQRQQRILNDILNALKPGGILIYSTCSYSNQENEMICDWMIKEQALNSIQIKTNPNWNIVETSSALHHAFGYRFYPDKLKGEGFFIAAFEKPNIAIQKIKYNQTNKIVPIKKTNSIQQWVKDNPSTGFFNWKDDVIAFPQNLFEEISNIQSTLYIKKTGITIGSLIRDELIPSHELSMSTIKSESIHTIDIDLQTALSFLRFDLKNLLSENKGWNLVSYKNTSLGFIKVLPNRINNYYPKEWRIIHK